MDTKRLVNSLRRLTPDALRRRLAEIDAEARALRSLLRAAIIQHGERRSDADRQEVKK